jgi:hypothetical protein
MGNLVRATFVGSSNNVWPWSYDKCDRNTQSQQKFSHCNRVAHYGLHARQGRGAPEVDVFEVMPGVHEELANTQTKRPYMSSSLQVVISVYCMWYVLLEHCCVTNAMYALERGVFHGRSI